MSHETPVLSAVPRERTGTRYARRLRAKGRLPAVVYGHGGGTASVHVSEKELVRAVSHGAHVIELDVDGGGRETVLVKDLQFGWLGDNVIHVDFTRVDLTEQVEVNVHIEFTGMAKESLKTGAVTRHDMTELPVQCAVKDIPDSITVNQDLMEGTTFTAGEVTLPAGVELTVDPSTPVVTINFATEIETGEAAEVEGEASPEVIGDTGETEEAEASEETKD